MQILQQIYNHILLELTFSFTCRLNIMILFKILFALNIPLRKFFSSLFVFVQVDFSPTFQKLAHIVNSISSQLIKTISVFKRLPDLLTREHSQRNPIHSIIGTLPHHLILYIPPFFIYALFIFLFTHAHVDPNPYDFLLWNTKEEIMKKCMGQLF